MTVATLARTAAPGPSPAELAYLRPARTCLPASPPPVPRRLGWRLRKGAAAKWSRRLPPRRRRRGPGAAPLGGRPNLPRHPGTGLSSPGPPYLVMAQSEVRGGDARSPAGMCVGATGEPLPRARGGPDPRETWPDRPPRRGVTIRSQEREPGLPLGPALRRQQLHPRSAARPRPPPPRDGEESQK